VGYSLSPSGLGNSHSTENSEGPFLYPRSAQLRAGARKTISYQSVEEPKKTTWRPKHTTLVEKTEIRASA
jgi:hypothetical protein